MRLFLLLAFPVIVLSIISSCNKSDRDEDTETQSSKDYITAENVFSDVFNQVVKYSLIRPELNYTDSSKMNPVGCPVLTITSAVTDTMTFPKTLLINYSSAGCTDGGITRKGQIKSTLNRKIKKAGSVMTIAFTDYSFNGWTVNGAYSIKHNGYNTAGKRTFTMNIADANITSTNGTIYWASSETRTWIEGDTTTAATDDIFEIIGNGTGQGIKGTSYEYTITKNLQHPSSCGYIQSGLVSLSPANLGPRSIDFGSGCDDKAKVTINGTDSDISIK